MPRRKYDRYDSLPQDPHAASAENVQQPREPRMSSFAIGIAFAVSSVFAFLFLAFPLGSPFVRENFNLAATLLAVFLFVSRCVSLACYSTQWWKENKAARAASKQQVEADAKPARGLLPTIMEFFKVFGGSIKIAAFAFIGFAIGLFALLTLTLTDTFGPAMGFDIRFVNGLFFFLFTGGSFLSIAFRLRGDLNKGDVEIKGVRWVAIFCLAAAIGAILVTAIGSDFLTQFSALSGYSILGMNVFVGLLLSVISLTAYVGKALDLVPGSKKEGVAKAEDSKEERRRKNEDARKQRCARKYWEYRGAWAGLLMGAVCAILVLVFKVNPFGEGGVLVQIGTAIMTFAAFPSLFTELGRAFDEERRAAPEKTPIDLQIGNHPTRPTLYFVALRWSMSIGLFVTLGFALSPLAGQYGLSIGLFSSPLFTFALAAVAVIGIFTWKGLSQTPAVQDVPSHHALASVEPALQILNRLRDLASAKLADGVEQKKALEQEEAVLRDALHVHITRTTILLQPPEGEAAFEQQRGMLLEYGETKNWRNAEFAGEIAKDYAVLEQANNDIASANIDILQRTFKKLREVKIDPHYRPILLQDKKHLLVLGSVTSTGGALVFLGLILLRKLSVEVMPWIGLLPAVFGFFSFIYLRRLLNQMRGGPYTVLQVLAVLSSIVFLGLTIIALVGLPFMGLHIGTVLTTFFAIAAFVSVEGVFLLSRKAKQYAERITPDTESKKATWLLNVLKGMAGLVLLGVAYSSIGLFSAYGLDSLRYFFQHVLQLDPASLGLASIGIFAIAMCMAFELYKSILQPSPGAVTEIAASKDRIALGDLVFKLAVALPILLLNKMSPAFTVLIFVLPFFSGRTHIPFLSEENNARLKNFFGVARYNAQGQEFGKLQRFARECGVVSLLGLLVLISTFITGDMLGNVNVAGVVSGIGMAVTLFSRWSAMWQAYCDPVLLADNLVQHLDAEVVPCHQHDGVGVPLAYEQRIPLSPSPSPAQAPPSPAPAPIENSAVFLACST